MTVRIFYAAGPGNVIGAHRHWERGEVDPTQMSLTFSGQFADFCRAINADAFITAHIAKSEIYRSGNFFIEHAPKWMSGASGIRFHLSEILHGLRLVVKAVKFRADFAVVHSGSTYEFMLSPLHLLGIRVIPVLHNTPWPKGFEPTKRVQRYIKWLDAFQFRWWTHAVIGVSPECIRQVKTMIGPTSSVPLIDMRGQFVSSYFKSIPLPPSHDERPFRVTFSGRVTQDKGVFDLLSCARKVNERFPGLVEWTVCGEGPDLHRLRQQSECMGLERIVKILGFIRPEKMKEVLGQSHATIVPTRSEFPEGMALSAVESILAGRPCLTSRVVPALEMLEPACLEATTNDVESYARAIIKLATSADLYQSLCSACAELAEPFYDRNQGFESALEKAIVRSAKTAAGAPNK